MAWLLAGYVIVAAGMGLLWLLQRRIGDAGVVDVGWSLSLGLLAGILAVGGEGDASRRALLAVLAGAWSLRLGTHLLIDRVLARGEDGRYQMLRESWGARQQPYMFLFFQAQALIAVLFAVPFLVVAGNPRSLGPLDVVAVALWLVAVGGEAVADRQLARFKADPANKGRTCRVGLWSVSRHPNYFFEWLHWFAYVVLAVGAPHAWLSLLGPVAMLLFLLRVTGIPYTERRALLSRGEDYARYQREVSPFIPWFSRKERVS
jgi:steroid 5-alpha reductase family enzyme